MPVLRRFVPGLMAAFASRHTTMWSVAANHRAGNTQTTHPQVSDFATNAAHRIVASKSMLDEARGLAAWQPVALTARGVEDGASAVVHEPPSINI
jgi:hypothetical protein